jgi:hypothetical protein
VLVQEQKVQRGAAKAGREKAKKDKKKKRKKKKQKKTFELEALAFFFNFINRATSPNRNFNCYERAETSCQCVWIPIPNQFCRLILCIFEFVSPFLPSRQSSTLLPPVWTKKNGVRIEYCLICH